jgi:hypothetical protein
MKTLKYFLFLVILVRSGIFTEPLISPLQNQTYLLSAGSHGLKVSRFGQAFVFSGYWSQIIEIQFPSILETNFTLPKISLNCRLQHFSTVYELCDRYNALLDATHNASISYNRLK